MITGMNHVTLAVTDIEKSFHFYRDILGLKPLCRWDKSDYSIFSILININLKFMSVIGENVSQLKKPILAHGKILNGSHDNN